MFLASLSPQVAIEAMEEYAEVCHGGLPTEKVVEDLHQHCRDKQRARRHKSIAVARIYSATIQSGVLEAVKVAAPKIDNQKLASQTKRKIRQQKANDTTKAQLPPKAHHFGPQINETYNTVFIRHHKR